jgi:hypothetical protein
MIQKRCEARFRELNKLLSPKTYLMSQLLLLSPLRMVQGLAACAGSVASRIEGFLSGVSMVAPEANVE